MKIRIPITLPETNIAPENGWLEYDCFLVGPGPFSGVNLLLVLGSVNNQDDSWKVMDSGDLDFQGGIFPQSVRLEVIVTIVSKLAYFTYLGDVSNLLIYWSNYSDLT